MCGRTSNFVKSAFLLGISLLAVPAIADNQSPRAEDVQFAEDIIRIIDDGWVYVDDIGAGTPGRRSAHVCTENSTATR